MAVPEAGLLHGRGLEAREAGDNLQYAALGKLNEALVGQLQEMPAAVDEARAVLRVVGHAGYELIVGRLRGRFIMREERAHRDHELHAVDAIAESIPVLQIVDIRFLSIIVLLRAAGCFIIRCIRLIFSQPLNLDVVADIADAHLAEVLAARKDSLPVIQQAPAQFQEVGQREVRPGHLHRFFLLSPMHAAHGFWSTTASIRIVVTCFSGLTALRNVHVRCVSSRGRRAASRVSFVRARRSKA